MTIQERRVKWGRGRGDVRGTDGGQAGDRTDGGRMGDGRGTDGGLMGDERGINRG